MRRGNYEYGLGFRVWVLMHPIDLISWERVHCGLPGANWFLIVKGSSQGAGRTGNAGRGHL